MIMGTLLRLASITAGKKFAAAVPELQTSTVGTPETFAAPSASPVPQRPRGVHRRSVRTRQGGPALNRSSTVRPRAAQAAEIRKLADLYAEAAGGEVARRTGGGAPAGLAAGVGDGPQVVAVGQDGRVRR